jgi:hypothetical protein
MNTYRTFAQVATLAMAAGTGWVARDATLEAPPAEPVQARPVCAPAPKPVSSLVTEPLIAVSSDGQVTLRVEQQPLEWVLEQIALQSGDTHLRERARPAEAGAATRAAADPAVRSDAAKVEAVCTEAQVVSPGEVERALGEIQRGTERERFEGLLTVGASGIQVPEAMLKTLFETDASDRVRLAAFERYVEPLGGDPTALRDVLEAARYVPNAAVQAEAQRRLDELIEASRPDPSDPQQAPP